MISVIVYQPVWETGHIMGTSAAGGRAGRLSVIIIIIIIIIITLFSEGDI